MALQVWLPLNGNLNNQGLTDVTVTNSGATVDNNGKIGKCYSFDGTYVSFNKPLPNPCSAFTVCGWVKLSTGYTANNGLHLVSFETSYGRICISKDGHAVRVLLNYNGTTSATGSIAAASSISANVWNHYAVTFDSGKINIYINGQLDNSYTVNISQVSITSSILKVGTYSSEPSKGCVNDFRLYDNALSPKEIEILSRGLVCHYPLNNNGSGQPNLYNFESVASLWKTGSEELILVDATDDVYGNVLKLTIPSSVDSARIYRGVKNVWKADTNFTVSFLAKASKTAVLKIERSRTDYAPDVTVGTTWKRYSTVIPCSATTTGGGLGIQTSTASADIYITQIKLELGDKATAYCPGVGDSHYIPLGYDSTTIYDCSGYQNNAIPWAYDNTGSIDISSDTARYSASTFINSANPTSGQAAGTRYIYGNCELTKPEKLTVAFWCKPITGYASTTGHGEFSLTNYNIGQYAAADYQEAPLNHRDAAFDINGISEGTYVHKRLSVDFTANQWHHYAVVYDGRYAKLYKDGVQSSNADMGAIMPLGSMKGIVIGFSKAGGVWRHVQSYYSDVRLYATALSADDIKELYNTAVSVANNGTLMGYELVEV